jgi:glycosyltransferase involved in cell wall biosynthesis
MQSAAKAVQGGTILLDKPPNAKPSDSAPAPVAPILGDDDGARPNHAVAKNWMAQLRDVLGTLLARMTNGKNGTSTTEIRRVETRQDQRSEHNIDRTALSRFSGARERPHVRGKFLFVGEEKFWVRGVTYGTFRPDESGANYPSPDVVERDFRAIRNAGLNSLRVYTVPPRWLLDLAAAQGLRVMVGLWWEQHVAFLNDRARARSIIARMRKDVAECAGHPAVLCYAIGNEITGSIVRWYRGNRVQRFLGKLCNVIRQEDPGALVTYVNYPTTEYLELSCVDFVAFNVYLESRERLSAYLARLQNLAGERPLLLAEVGLDSRRNGLDEQAAALKWQIETIFEAGCTGTFVFAWTDEWNCAGDEIEDWDFGLTTRDRRAKPALGSVAETFKETPFVSDQLWPRISVVVCSYNGANTIEETLLALSKLNYPDYEVIVVNDGSTDATSIIAPKYGVSLIQSENKGLSSARNLGMEAATGEIIAYIDDDAYPDPDWLKFLAASFMRTDHAGIGGPNIAPDGDGIVADSVAHAPGGPVHVLLSDEVAEHIPGCNMAYRLDRLREIGGFDPHFKIAGDDVDICWRLQDRGWTLGFSPAAMVWHHRRDSIRAYWKQQTEYARAEALLAEKWPQKYNGAGHLNWQGRLYGAGVAKFFLSKSRVYHGTWGGAIFQSIYGPAAGLLSALPLMPEWYFVVALLGSLAALGFAWPPLLLLLPIFAVAIMLSLVQAAGAGATAPLRSQPPLRRFASRILVALLCLLQPLARLLGRIRHGLGPWRWTGVFVGPVPMVHERSIWSENWQSCEARLTTIQSGLLRRGAVVNKGGDFDRWDLSVGGGLFGSIRALAMVEEHGRGKQLFRMRAWPKVPALALCFLLVMSVLATLAAFDQAWLAAVSLGLMAFGVSMLMRAACAKAMTTWMDAIDDTFASTNRLRLSESTQRNHWLNP